MAVSAVEGGLDEHEHERGTWNLNGPSPALVSALFTRVYPYTPASATAVPTRSQGRPVYSTRHRFIRMNRMTTFTLYSEVTEVTIHTTRAAVFTVVARSERNRQQPTLKLLHEKRGVVCEWETMTPPR